MTVASAPKVDALDQNEYELLDARGSKEAHLAKEAAVLQHTNSYPAACNQHFACKKTVSFLSAFPMFVPSLSW